MIQYNKLVCKILKVEMGKYSIGENMNKEKVIQHRIQNLQQFQHYNADYLATAICKTSPRLQSYNSKWN